MARLPKVITLSLQGYNYRAYFQKDPKVYLELKKILGVSWDRDDAAWVVPADAIDLLEDIAAKENYTIEYKDIDFGTEVQDSDINEKLHDYQRKDVLKVLNEKSYLLNYEMGLGKTPTTIEIVRLSQTRRTLVVCPALVRLNWIDELEKWWPGHPEVVLLDTGKKAKEYRASLAENAPPQVCITSYALVQYLADIKFGCIVLDECHYVKEARAARSKHIAALRRANLNNNTIFIGLSGTPITSEPKDLWHQLHILRPETYSNWHRFVKRYSNHIDSSHTNWDYRGLNPLHAKELQTRLGRVSSRVTKNEVGHLLPPFNTTTIRVRPKRKIDFRAIYDNLSSGIRKQHELDGLVETAGNEKIKPAIEAVVDAIGSGERTCAIAYYRKHAKLIAEGLEGKGYKVCYVDGAIPVNKRVHKINESKTQKDTILVATISSINVGIDLTVWTTAIIAELYWRPATMIQALGRFSRLSGTLPSTCILLVLKGSLDEVIAKTLERRLKEQASVFDAGLAEESITSSLKEDPEQVLKELRAAAETWIERDEYL